MRSRKQIDEYVIEIIRRRLAKPDLKDLLPTDTDPRLSEIRDEINAHRAKIHRAQRDYDDEIIEGFDLKRIRDRENAAIDTLEVERLRLTGNASGTVLTAEDPVTAFVAGDLAVRRRTIEVLCDIHLDPHPRGVKAFNPDTVRITWR